MTRKEAFLRSGEKAFDFCSMKTYNRSEESRWYKDYTEEQMKYLWDHNYIMYTTPIYRLGENDRNKYIQLREDCRSAASSLKAIYKINASNNKDKQIAIEALSEEYKEKEEISLQEQEKTQDMIKCDHDWYFDKAIPLTRGTAYHYRCSKCGALRKRFCSDDGCVYESTGEWQP